MNADLLLLQLALLAAFKLPSQGLTHLIFPASKSRFAIPDAQHSTFSIEEIKKTTTSMWFTRRFDPAPVLSFRHAACGTLFRSKLQISRENTRSGDNFTSRYAVDYIDACPANRANYRFFRALWPQLCYSSFALNTSVVLCGLW
jgi:hypothetical protein